MPERVRFLPTAICWPLMGSVIFTLRGLGVEFICCWSGKARILLTRIEENKIVDTKRVMIKIPGNTNLSDLRLKVTIYFT